MGSFRFNFKPTKRVTEEEYQSLMDHCTVEVGDLVMSRNQSVGVLSFADSKELFVLGQDTVLIKPENSDSKYLFYKKFNHMKYKKRSLNQGGSTFHESILRILGSLHSNIHRC